MTKHPIQAKHQIGKYFGYLSGAEYETIDKNQNQDVPCAVCQSYDNLNSLMLPGRNRCPDGWNQEYSGLLMSGYHKHAAASQYVCVDQAMKHQRNGSQNKDGKLFYPVQVLCGSLKCPPYKDRKLVTCAVCTN